MTRWRPVCIFILHARAVYANAVNSDIFVVSANAFGIGTLFGWRPCILLPFSPRLPPRHMHDILVEKLCGNVHTVIVLQSLGATCIYSIIKSSTTQSWCRKPRILPARLRVGAGKCSASKMEERSADPLPTDLAIRGRFAGSEFETLQPPLPEPRQPV